MMRRFEIDSGDGKKAIFDSYHISDDPYSNTYRLSFESPNMNATIEVSDLNVHGSLPNYLVRLVTASQKGFKGIKSWHSSEGEFSIESSMLNTGHVKMRIQMNVHRFPGDWVAIVEFIIEPERLKSIAREAKAFFERKFS